MDSVTIGTTATHDLPAVATARACTGAWSPREPVGADDLLASRRTGEIENKSIDRNRDLEFTFFALYQF